MISTLIDQETLKHLIFIDLRMRELINSDVVDAQERERYHYSVMITRFEILVRALLKLLPQSDYSKIVADLRAMLIDQPIKDVYGNTINGTEIYQDYFKWLEKYGDADELSTTE